jgi:hypothetical protein
MRTLVNQNLATVSENRLDYDAVLETSQKWADFLKKKERQEVIWRGVIAGVFQWSLLPILAAVDPDIILASLAGVMEYSEIPF